MTAGHPDFGRDVHCLLGLPFDIVDMAAALSRVRAAASGGPRCFLSTPNLNFLIGCHSDPAFRASVINSDLSIADGMPLVWMARLLGLPIRERVAGSSLFEALRIDGRQPLAVYFFGGPPGVAEQACARLNAEAGGLRCVGFESPGFGSVDEMSSTASIDRINASGADFVVVALGARKGQAWIERNRGRLSAPVISHLGAVVSFVAGSISRAPVWMQRAGLEWLWRIKEEPGLWRRYLADGLALVRLLATRVLPLALHLRTLRQPRRARQEQNVEWARGPGATVIRLRGRWQDGSLDSLRRAFLDVAASDEDIWLDLELVEGIDTAFLGQVLLLSGWQARRGRMLRIVSAPPVVRRIIHCCCADFLL